MRVTAVLLLLSTLTIGETTIWYRCGNQWYSPYMATCCNNNLHHHDTPEMAWYIACCGDIAYNTAYYMCCDGKIWSMVSPNQACCGSDIYFTDSQLCCNDAVQSLVGSWQPACCGNTSYDQAYSRCCNETIGSSVDMTQAECCGSTVYDVQEYKCCDGIIVFNYQICVASPPTPTFH